MLQVLWVRNLEVDQLGACGSESLMRLQSRYQLKGLTGPEDPLPRWLTHKAIGRRDQLLTRGPLHRAT